MPAVMAVWFKTLLSTSIRVIEVVFVGKDDAGLAFIENDPGNATILSGDASGPIDDEGTDISTTNATFRTHHAEDRRVLDA